MRKISTLFYGIGQGIKNIHRNKMFSLASIGTMAACLFLFGVFYFILTNFEYILNEAESNNIGVTVFFDEGISDEGIELIGERIMLRAEVSNIEFTSAEEAWEKYKAEMLNEELAETFGDDNPLEKSASYTVYLNDVTMQQSLVRYIAGLEGVRTVNDVSELAESLSGFNKVVAYVSGAIIIILLGVATFLISTTVTMGVSVRRQEISIMKLIGARDFFIRIPFIVEGIIIGLIGAGIPLFILEFGYSKIVGVLTEQLTPIAQTVQFLPVREVMKTLVPVSLLIGVGIGFLGSHMTLRKQLRRIEMN